MKVTVFGGAQAKPGDAIYNQAVQLGQLLGQAGCTVLTGGYMGSMEAVSQGAAEVGAHVIGVTCDEIERWRPIKANPWIKEEWRHTTLHERLLALLDSCDAAIALPGGVGTLAEIVLMWNRLLINSMQPRPLVLVGRGWQEVFSLFFETQDACIQQEDRRLLAFAKDVAQAARLVCHKSP